MGVQVIPVELKHGAGPVRARIEMDGIFDIRAVERVRSAVTALAGAADICLDFTRVGSIQDIALAQVARSLAGARECNIHTRGLSIHQDRLLRYLGFDPSTLHSLESGARVQPA